MDLMLMYGKLNADRKRLALYAFYLEYTAQEIALCMGVSVTTVNHWREEARKNGSDARKPPARGA